MMKETLDRQLRPATDGDLPFLLELYASSRSNEMTAWGWTARQQQTFITTQFSARRRQYDTVYPHREESILVVQGKPAGLVSVARGKEAMTLVDIAILPEHQRMGLGSEVVWKLQQQATEAGIALRLHILADNRQAAGFYRRLGFTGNDDGLAYRLLEWREQGETPPNPTNKEIVSGGIHA